jgi:hypothetical protein
MGFGGAMSVLVRFVFDNQPLPIDNPKHDRGGADFYKFRLSAIL